MRKLLVVGLSSFALGAGAVTALGLGGMVDAQQRAPRADAETYRMLELFGDVLATVQRNYVVPVDDKRLIEAAIDGMLASLDPHSGYLNLERFDDMRETTRGEYGGLGMEVTSEEGAVKVMAPMDGTPAARAGIQPGDIIGAINGQSLIGVGLTEAVDQLKGPVGTQVTLTIGRENVEPFDVTLTREVINVRSATARMEGDYGYLRVSAFNEDTASEAQTALATLIRENPNMKGLVLDLRNNPGGLLESSVRISDMFLDGGEVVSQRGRNPRDVDRYNAEPGDMLNGKPIVVLINAGSASAAEIVAGALQDRRRATVVGLTSFGKGSVQTLIPMRGGVDGALKLTTGRYYTPSGRSIQRSGIVPDLQVARSRQEAEVSTRTLFRISEANLRNALQEEGEPRRDALAEAILPPESYNATRDDFQLAQAFEVLRAGSVQTVRSRFRVGAQVASPNGAGARAAAAAGAAGRNPLARAPAASPSDAAASNAADRNAPAQQQQRPATVQPPRN